MKLYNIKKLYKDFKDAIGIQEDLTARMLWNDMITYKDDSIDFTKHFHNWLRNAEMPKKYIKL